MYLFLVLSHQTVTATGKAAIDAGWSFATTAASFVSSFFFGTEDETTNRATDTAK